MRSRRQEIVDRTWWVAYEWFTDQWNRVGCWLAGYHLWDSERPSGPMHEHDFCWRCGKHRTGADEH